MKPDTGGATIGGIPVWNHIHLYELIGFCPDMEKFYERPDRLGFLTYMARLHGNV
jgi:ABC-type multidrug transport system ATPase subunit